MNISLKCSGQIIAERSAVCPRPAARKVMVGSALISVRLLRATHPVGSSPTLIDALSSCGASTPVVNRHFSESLSDWCRKSAHPDHGTIFASFDEMSAIVSDTPRLVPMACAIS
jgi:hypothetical protein